MDNWNKKSEKRTKLYSWFHEIIDEENIIHDDDVQIEEAWYKFISGKLISGNKTVEEVTHVQELTPDDLWF
jgi:hypothetical protein